LNVGQSDGELSQFGDLAEDFLGDQVDAPVLGPEVDSPLEPG